MKFVLQSVALAGLITAAAARDIPSNVQSFLARVKSGQCTGGKVLKQPFYSTEGGSEDFAYCLDTATGVLYLHGSGSNLANMDIDCDGDQSNPGDGRCGNSADTQSETAFKDLVQQYSSGSGSSNANPSGSIVSGSSPSATSLGGSNATISTLRTSTISGTNPAATIHDNRFFLTTRTSGSQPTATSPSTSIPSGSNSTISKRTAVSDLNANFIPYVVFGNEGSKSGYTTFDPQQYGLEPLSVMAVVCGDKLVYGVWGDTNGDDGPPMIGEASIALATECFGTGITGDNGHDTNDVLYIAFPGSVADTVVQNADWGATSFTDFENSISALGDSLVAKLS